MTKREFVELMQKKSNGWTLRQCNEAYDIFRDSIQYALLHRETVVMKELFTLSAVPTPERVGRNPVTGKEYPIKKRLRPKCNFSKVFKQKFVR